MPSLRTIGMWALAALIVWWVVQNPTAAGGLVHSVGAGISHVAHSATTALNTATSSGGG